MSDQLADAVAPHFFAEIEQRVYIIRVRYIEIRDTESREVVTTVELLSPFNKTPGHVGYDAFQRKRQQVMASNVHWIEVDLLRAGERPAEVSEKSDYYALLKRGETVGPYEVWYFDLRDRMPTIAVPLRSPFDDVPLDLQTAFEELYKRVHYDNSIDYTRPVPPLSYVRPMPPGQPIAFNPG